MRGHNSNWSMSKSQRTAAIYAELAAREMLADVMGWV